MPDLKSHTAGQALADYWSEMASFRKQHGLDDSIAKSYERSAARYRRHGIAAAYTVFGDGDDVNA